MKPHMRSNMLAIRTFLTFIFQYIELRMAYNKIVE